MIRIAICDDEADTLLHLTDIITQYGVQKELRLSIQSFSAAKDLAVHIQGKNHYQIYLLDMLMPQINGIEIGQLIRSQDEHAAIIYLTTSADYAYQAYSVFAQRYLLKPLKKPELYEALDFAVSQTLLRQKSLHVNTVHGIQQIMYQEIEYVECSARALHIYDIGGTEVVSRLLRKSFESNMSGLLQSGDFIQTHKSFIVNLSQVRLYDPNQMTMWSGAQIPISKSRQTAVKRMYLKYIAETY